MQIEVDEIEYCKLRVHYEADSDQISAKKTEILGLFKNAPVPGFRKGKASVDAINVHYKNQINESLKRALAEEAFHNTLFEKELKPFGAPIFDNILLTGNKFICDFKCNVQPTFTLGQYKGIEVPKPVVKDSNEMAEAIMQQLREQHGDQSPYGENDFIQTGDIVIVSYEGSCEGEKINALCVSGEMVKVGQSNIKEFDENILGMKIGEERDFTLTVPKDGLPSLAGKDVSFHVNLISGSKINPAPLNDDLARRLGKETFEDLRQMVAQAAVAKVDLQKKTEIITQISAKLVEMHDFKIPDWLCLSEAKYLAQQSKITWDELPDVDKERFLNMGANNVKASLLLDKIRDVEPDAQLSDQEVLDTLKQTLAKANPGKDPDEFLKEFSKNGYLQSLYIRIRDEHVLGFLADNAKIIE